MFLWLFINNFTQYLNILFNAEGNEIIIKPVCVTNLIINIKLMSSINIINISLPRSMNFMVLLMFYFNVIINVNINVINVYF